MKNLLLLALLLCAAPCLRAQEEDLAALNGLTLESIAGEEPAPYDFQKHTAGKIVWIEFWEHWCAPCIAAMPRLAELQEAFPEELKIVAVSADDRARSRSFIAERDYPFDFVFDEEGLLRRIFPHRAIPHSVLLDKEGNFVGVAHPEQVTEQTIRDLLAGKPVDLPSEEGYAPPTAAEMIAAQKEEVSDDAPSLLSFVLKKTEYESGQSSSRFRTPGEEGELVRRVELKGYTPTQLVAGCYEIPEFRIIRPEIETQEERYDLFFACSDPWTADADALLRSLIGPALGVEVLTIEQETEVWLWTGIRAGEAIKNRELSRSASTNQSSGERFFQVDGILTGEDLTAILEAKTGVPVLFQTGGAHYQVDLDIRHEGQGSERIFELLNQAGIVLEKARRPVRYLEIIPKNNK